MNNLTPLTRRAWAPLAILISLLMLPLSSTAVAQNDPSGSQGTEATQLTKQEEKERAKQARIEEYLRKREQRIAEKEMRRQQRQSDQLAAPAAAGSVGAAATTTSQKTSGAEEVVLPKDLAEAQTVVRGNEIAQDPTVAEYLDLIDRAEASPQQLAAFGNFLADYGAPRLAVVYYGVALSIEEDDPVLWLNVGTLHRKLQEYDAAINAYSRALSLDPNLAYAHYNLGATLDDQRKYDDALEEYRIALTLDPTLGDPKINPQAANNERLLAVKLMLYEEQIGNRGMPLVEVPGGELATPKPEND